ncbi:MAG: NAD(P)H-binding protein [Myxococcota bacterium]
MTRPVLVAGATGFVGRHVIERLLEQGRSVVGGTRNPERAKRGGPIGTRITWRRFDIRDPSSHDPALEGIGDLVYLVHLMRTSGGNLVEQEAKSAHQVVKAAERSGVRRIVYLGGPQPNTRDTPSHHLNARLVTGSILRASSVPTVELQAAMIIGAESESWRIVRDLALRLPVMALPVWLDRKSEPLGIDDVVDAIVGALDPAVIAPTCLALPGPEAVSGRGILERVAAHAGIRPIMVPMPLLGPKVSSHWIRIITRADFTVARQLVDGLRDDLIATSPTWWEVSRRTPTSLDEAIQRALQAEPPSSFPPMQRTWERLVAALSFSPDEGIAAPDRHRRPPDVAGG